MKTILASMSFEELEHQAACCDDHDDFKLLKVYQKEIDRRAKIHARTPADAYCCCCPMPGASAIA